MVGVETVIRDDPSLTVRRVPLREGRGQPIRVVLDRSLRLPSGCKILRDGYSSIIYYTGEESSAAEQRAKELRAGLHVPHGQPPPKVDLCHLPSGEGGWGIAPRGVLDALGARGVRHVLLEGGPTTAKAFLEEGVVDNAIIVRAPVEFSQPVPSGIDSGVLESAGLVLLGSKMWGSDSVDCWCRRGRGWPTKNGGQGGAANLGVVDGWP
ncbi:unnamed protein product [Discosporangium mesarthrocarpum]